MCVCVCVEREKSSERSSVVEASSVCTVYILIYGRANIKIGSFSSGSLTKGFNEEEEEEKENEGEYYNN